MTTAKKSRSRTLTEKVLFNTLVVLRDAGGVLKRQEVLARLEDSLEFTDWELEPAGEHGQIRWTTAIWYTTDASKAGFMTKDNGVWSITPRGIEALELGPAGLLDAARAAYREWRARKKGTGNGDGGKLGAWTRAQIMRAGLLILQGAPDGAMPAQEFLRRLPGQLPEDLLETLESYHRDWARDYGYRTFYRAVNARWLTRHVGVWTITPAGRGALEEWPEARELWEAAKQIAGQAGEVDEKLPYLGQLSNFQGISQTLYKQGSATVGQLVSEIELGTLALPDIQRPFVWKNTKVRDLLDSIYRGYPFGYILTWQSLSDAGARQIGTGDKGTAVPHALVIDGQQRLTSLFAVMTGKKVLDKNFKGRRIRIAFHPLSATFAVADAAVQSNPEWLPDISELFTHSMGALAIVREYLAQLEASREVLPVQVSAVEHNIERLVNIKNTPLSVLEIGNDANEEQVAEVFVRINSRGQNLKQADFILTLLAVFWQEGREGLEKFARQCRQPSDDGTPSPFNHQLRPGADDMIRVVVAAGHRRARLSAAYQVLRGKDPELGRITEEARVKNLRILEQAQNEALEPGNWHEFLKMIAAAGYRHSKQIHSMNTALYAYSLFLIGRRQFGVPLQELRYLIGRWFMMSVLTGRYVGGSSESMMEEDLARLRGLEMGGAEEFQSVLEGAMAAELTNDFWKVTLPSRLESSSQRTIAPFFAAQCVLGANALFSTLPVAHLLAPDIASTKEGLEVHHLFPKAWLKSNGFTDVREYNQVANLALLEWDDNVHVGGRAPEDYGPELEDRVPENEIAEIRRMHALPEDWWDMPYPEFLAERRRLISRVLRDAFKRLDLGSGSLPGRVSSGS